VFAAEVFNGEFAEFSYSLNVYAVSPLDYGLVVDAFAVYFGGTVAVYEVE